ncbi:glycosyltransferase involved in cell wall biosynthesis [Undibacterium sp. GrIS 1.8]|uniref:glycosyltransferase family 4 protein n=1 Tax=Undibacterium sp. GrIS 1.8 TaxID=3143934 RepID=UPI00339233A2
MANKMTPLSHYEPTIWFNVTTSANWTRPPVGIVRVEMALCDELNKIYGDIRFKRCAWIDGQFIEYISPKIGQTEEVEVALDAILPDSASFDLARLFLAKALSQFKIKEADQHISLSIPTQKSSKHKPVAGDILISIGLDWDQPYSQHFYQLQKENGIRVVTCCYDLIPVLFPQYCVGEVARRFKEYFTQLSWGSEAVLCISEQTKRDYISLCSELGAPARQTCVIPLGDNVPSELGAISKQVLDIVEEPYILFVSTIERRKNHEVLYRAYHLLAKAGHYKILPKLVFVGMPGWGVGDLLKDIELDPLTHGFILQLNHVNDAELNQLYKRALFCVYPSLYEGWGLPVGEALALGKVVISSNYGSLPEVGGDLVKYVDPWNPQAWADAILNLLENPLLISEIELGVKQKYLVRKWSQTAKVVSNLIDELVANPKKEWLWLPGYDMSTQAGIHVGGSIVASGEHGFLLYGPHRALPKGSYDVSIFGQTGHGNGDGTVLDVVAEHGGCVLGESLITTLGDSGCLATIRINVESDYDDLEVRVRGNNLLGMTITLVKINRV